MSSPLYASVPAAFQRAITSLTATNGTTAKVLVDAQPAVAASATTPLYYGGATVVEMSAVTTSLAALSLLLWSAQVLTTVGGGTGAATTTASTINRAAGSFITDGFKVGDTVMLFAPQSEAPNAAVDGIVGVVTAVAALQINVNGSPFGSLSLVTGTRICRAALKHRAAVPASSGNSDSVDSVDLLHGGPGDGFADRSEWKLGATDILAVSAASALAALPVYAAVEAAIARY